MSNANAVAEELADLFSRDDLAVDLARAALMVARFEYPTLKIDDSLGRLQALADAVSPRLEADRSPSSVIQILSDFLFDQEGFRGNTEDYYDPRNSFLNDVIERKKGIPITLSIVYLDLARRLGLPLFGVGLPGHFVVKHDDGDTLLYVDPFYGGEILDRIGCAERAGSVLGKQVAAKDIDFSAVSERAVIQRMLGNLRGIYTTGEQYRKAADVLYLLSALDPVNAELHKQRALMHYQIRDLARARRDFEQYLALSPDASDADEVQKYVAGLQALQAMMN